MVGMVAAGSRAGKGGLWKANRSLAYPLSVNLQFRAADFPLIDDLRKSPSGQLHIAAHNCAF